jgi:hypothetical protein
MNKGFSEHKHCDNAATNANSENDRSRMGQVPGGSVSRGAKKDESSSGRVWAAEFHNITARYPLGGVWKLMNRLFI